MKTFRVVYIDERMFSTQVKAVDEEDAQEKADKYIAENNDEWYYGDENYDIEEI